MDYTIDKSKYYINRDVDHHVNIIKEFTFTSCSDSDCTITLPSDVANKVALIKVGKFNDNGKFISPDDPAVDENGYSFLAAIQGDDDTSVRLVNYVEKIDMYGTKYLEYGSVALDYSIDAWKALGSKEIVPYDSDDNSVYICYTGVSKDVIVVIESQNLENQKFNNISWPLCTIKSAMPLSVQRSLSKIGVLTDAELSKLMAPIWGDSIQLASRINFDWQTIDDSWNPFVIDVIDFMDLKDDLSDVNCAISHNWPDNAEIVCDSLEISSIGTENNFSFDVELNPTYTWEETSSGSYWWCNFNVSKIPDQFNPTWYTPDMWTAPYLDIEVPIKFKYKLLSFDTGETSDYRYKETTFHLYVTFDPDIMHDSDGSGCSWATPNDVCNVYNDNFRPLDYDAEMENPEVVHALTQHNLDRFRDKKIVLEKARSAINMQSKEDRSETEILTAASSYITLGEVWNLNPSNAPSLYLDETLNDSNDVMAGSYNNHTYQKESLTHFESFAYFHNYYNIPQRCFANCTNLSKIYLPIEQTISFGDECFMLCTNLSELGSLKTS